MELAIAPYSGVLKVQRSGLLDSCTNTIELMRGFTAAHLDRGADRIYLFNHMDSETTIINAEEYNTLL